MCLMTMAQDIPCLLWTQERQEFLLNLEVPAGQKGKDRQDRLIYHHT